MEDRKEILDLLQDLAQTCRDGQEGYRNAALHIQAPELHRYFDEQSLERARFAGEIEEEVQRLGKPDPKRTGTVGGTIHRAWINLKAGLGGGDLAILSAVEAGEDTAKEKYEKIFEHHLPESIAALLRQQHQSVLAAHDYVKMARDRRKAA
jgi:uncharacterized protein (TIGR02284 family)